MGAINRADTEKVSGLTEFNIAFVTEARVAQSLVFCVMFVDHCCLFSHCPCGHCIVCPSINDFWLSCDVFKFFLNCRLFNATVLLSHLIEKGQVHNTVLNAGEENYPTWWQEVYCLMQEEKMGGWATINTKLSPCTFMINWCLSK